MPPSCHELSLRHLPDVSDSSFSFQIPGAIQDDNLLRGNDLDFFEGADVSIAPLATSPFTTTEPPFTITPKPEKPLSSKDGSKLNSFPTLSYDHSEDRDTIPKQKKANLHQLSKATTSTNVNGLSKPKPNVITTSSALLPSSQGSPVPMRLDNLRVELDLFSDEFTGHSASSVNHQESSTAVRPKLKGILRKTLEKKKLQISPRNNQKVIEGGITKTRCATELPSITSCAPDHTDVLPIQQRQEMTLSDTKQVNNGDYSFADSSMSSAAAGVAGRLVMYSQKLINSTRLEPNSVCQESTSQDEQVDAVVDQDADTPLTLSQLSPQKSHDPSPTPWDNVLVSPSRLTSKRPISVASNVLHKRKKSRTDAASADSLISKPTVVSKARLPVTNRHAKPNASNSSSELRLHRSLRRKPMSSRVNGIKRPPVFKPGAPESDVTGKNSEDMGMVTSASSSRRATSASTSRLKNSKEKDAEPVNSITLNDKSKNVASSRMAQPATRPVSFNFQTDKRVHKNDQDRNQDANEDGVQSGSQREKRQHFSTTIPDFKAMHAAQEAELALRKENIKPVVPLPVHWETDYRLKERQKFDERVREKEREQERLMEMRRREREEEEEREVRELRKKAVPKAHEVPEWYKEAPKKKKDNAIVGSVVGVNE